MNYMLRKSACLLSVLLLAGCAADKGEMVPSVCTICGEVIGRPESKALLLYRSGEDTRVKSTRVPIVDGKFEYRLKPDHMVAWEFAFREEFANGSWRPVSFFPDNDTIRMKLHSAEEWEKNEILGGKLNREYFAYKELRKNTFDYTPIEKERDELIRFLQQVNEWETQYTAEHVSIPSYHLLRALICYSSSEVIPDKSGQIDLYKKVYAPAYPDHPYTKQIAAFLQSQNLQPGAKYIDFTAPDFEGRPVTLSTQIAGKVAMIDLWASWCGPCIDFSKSLIPVYEKYKDRGFTVVGVAREATAENGIRAARRYGYPWLTLLEVEDAANIWNLYGVGNSGGGAFLVDRDGTLLAIQPGIEEVEKILSEKLGAQ